MLALASACARQKSPADVALEYGRALYASDAAAIYRLLSDADRRVRDEQTFTTQQPALDPFARRVLRQLSSYATATPLDTTVHGERATVRLRFRLPDANAPEVSSLVHGWDEARLAALPEAERDRITGRLAELHRTGTLPTVEGEETILLVKNGDAWRVFLDWASGVHLRFGATVAPGLPATVDVVPADVAVNRGERLRVTVRAKNPSAREVTMRVGHRIEPASESRYLALLQCPLFVPITLAPGETREFVSVYLLLDDTPRPVSAFDVRYDLVLP